MENLFGKTLSELTEMLVAWGMPKFRGKQLADWMYKKSITDFNAMQNLKISAEFRRWRRGGNGAYAAAIWQQHLCILAGRL